MCQTDTKQRTITRAEKREHTLADMTVIEPSIVVVMTCANTCTCPYLRPIKIETTIAAHNKEKYTRKMGWTINPSRMY